MRQRLPVRCQNVTSVHHACPSAASAMVQIRSSSLSHYTNPIAKLDNFDALRGELHPDSCCSLAAFDSRTQASDVRHPRNTVRICDTPDWKSLDLLNLTFLPDVNSDIPLSSKCSFLVTGIASATDPFRRKRIQKPRTIARTYPSLVCTTPSPILAITSTPEKVQSSTKSDITNLPTRAHSLHRSTTNHLYRNKPRQNC